MPLTKYAISCFEKPSSCGISGRDVSIIKCFVIGSSMKVVVKR